MEHPTVSVVITARNEEKTIGACLDSVCRQDYANIVEIIVVDDDSTDRTPEIVRERERCDKRVRFIELESSRGVPPYALGFSQASGEYAQMFDGDVTVEPHYISKLVEFARMNDLAGAAGLRWNIDPTLIEDLMNIHFWIHYLDNPSVIREPPFLSSTGVLYRRADLSNIGNYDTSLIGSQDMDLGYRLRERGYRLGYDRELLIYHKGRHYQSLAGVYRQQRWYGRGAAQLAVKYPFRYAAEQNKVRHYLIRPATWVGLWLVLTVTLGLLTPIGALLVQALPLVGAARYLRRGWALCRRLRGAPTPTPVRTISCWLYPAFVWARRVLYTLFYLRNVPPPNELQRIWGASPVAPST